MSLVILQKLVLTNSEDVCDEVPKLMQTVLQEDSHHLYVC